MNDLLNWQALYEWAIQQEEGTVVGTCTNSDCPLANYLFQKTGKLWSVGLSIRSGSVRLQKEEWTERLIDLVDQTTGRHPGRVTREQFLNALERVKPLAEED